MNSYILISCFLKDESYVLKKLLQVNTDIISTKQKDGKLFYVINENDYNELIKYDYKKIIMFEKYCGLKDIKEKLKTNIEKIIISLSILIILFLSNLYIIKVNVHANDLNLKKTLTYSLIDEGIKAHSIKKSYKEISIIKEKILNKYNDEIEWIEIVKKGYEYDVNIIKREKNKTINHFDRCNYVAVKSGTVKSITVKKGVLQVQENNYVNAGDILINGDIIYNEELKDSVCASGKITGETWYKVNVSYPLKKEYTFQKNNGMYNVVFKIFNKKYFLLNDKYIKPESIFKLGGKFLGINITKSKKTYHKKVKYTEEEAIKKSLEIARKKVKLKAGNKSTILSENILKKSVNNDKINIEVLITVEEELGVVENY